MSKQEKAWPHPPPVERPDPPRLADTKKGSTNIHCGRYTNRNAPPQQPSRAEATRRPLGSRSASRMARSCVERMKKNCRKKILKHHCLGDKISQRFSVLWPLDSIRQHIKVQHHGKETRDICQIYQIYQRYIPTRTKGFVQWKDNWQRQKNKRKLILKSSWIKVNEDQVRIQNYKSSLRIIVPVFYG